MELAQKRTRLAERQAVHDRISKELNRVRGEVERAALLTQETSAASKELAVTAVLEGTADAEARAEAAKAAFARAFEHETELREQVPALDHALGHVRREVEQLSGEIVQEERGLVLAALRARKPQAIDAFREAAALLLAIRHGGESISSDFDFERVRSDVGDLSITKRAQEIREEIRRGILEVTP
ncbi:MAG: hypothetical protein QM704_25425 [Anaeromyxobacteraceae bacterium]